MIAVSVAIVGAGVCAWGALCLLFWQGSWQLLYHPTTGVTDTPASAGMTFDPVGFATTDEGQPLLKGWWIPAAPEARFTRYTVLYLHGQNGNLGDTVEALAALHAVGVNVLAFDYRGYGQSQFAHPSETRWREDAESALKYLTGTRHLSASTVILEGYELGANLALEVGSQHSELAGIVLQDPVDSPASTIFNDPRARMIPAHLLVSDTWDAGPAAAQLRIPSLWFIRSGQPGKGLPLETPETYKTLAAKKMLVWLDALPGARKSMQDSLSRWLDDLHL